MASTSRPDATLTTGCPFGQTCHFAPCSSLTRTDPKYSPTSLLRRDAIEGTSLHSSMCESTIASPDVFPSRRSPSVASQEARSSFLPSSCSSDSGLLDPRGPKTATPLAMPCLGDCPGNLKRHFMLLIIAEAPTAGREGACPRWPGPTSRRERHQKPNPLWAPSMTTDQRACRSRVQSVPPIQPKLGRFASADASFRCAGKHSE